MAFPGAPALRLSSPNAGGLVQSLVEELDPASQQLRIPHVATKTQHNQRNKDSVK